MSKTQKFFIICGVVTAIGIFIAFMGFCMGGFVTKVEITEKGIQVHTPMQQNKETVIKKQQAELEAFTSMNLKVAYADVKIVPSDHYGIEWKLSEENKIEYKVEQDCLYINQEAFDSKFSISVFDWSMFTNTIKSQYITIYVPGDVSFKEVELFSDSGDTGVSKMRAESLWIENKYGNVTLSEIDSPYVNLVLDSGNLELENLKGSSLGIDSQYGKVELKDAEGEDIALVLDSGNLKMKNISGSSLSVDSKYGNIKIDDVKVSGQTDFEVDSGNMELVNADFGDLQINSKYGYLKGQKITAGSTILQLDSGDCNIEEVSLKQLDMEAQYGKVEIGFKDDLKDFNYDLTTKYGDIIMDNQDVGERYHATSENGKKPEIVITCDSGNIVIKGNR